MRLERSVAVKFLPEVFEGDADCEARFEREARVLASLNQVHPQVVFLLNFFDELRRRASAANK